MAEARRSHGIDVRQAVFEAVLIFVGVAAALAGQSWWDYRRRWTRWSRPAIWT